MAEIGSTAQASRSETVEFLRSALTYHINSFRSRRDQNRRRAATTKLAIIAFGALVTILLGLKSYTPLQQYDSTFSICAFVLSALVTAITAWDDYFGHRWLWIRYTETLGLLRSIEADLNYAASKPEIEIGVLDELQRRLQLALQETNAAWSEKRSHDTSSNSNVK